MKTKPLRFSLYFYFSYNLLKLTQKELFADVKENFSKFFKGKRLCWSLIVITLHKTYSFCLKEPPAQVFSCEFCKIFMNIFLTEHFRAIASDARRKELDFFALQLHSSIMERAIKNFWMFQFLRRKSSSIKTNRKFSNCANFRGYLISWLVHPKSVFCRYQIVFCFY